jgi:hypothetical protein
MRDYRKFKFTSTGNIILRTLEHYDRTESGKSWRAHPSKTEMEVVTGQNYENYITSIPFFNNWGDGASCRAKSSYTRAGYLPTYVATVSPFKKEKILASFEFLNESILRKSAGWRENNILDNAKCFTTEIVDGARMITFYTDYDMERGESAIFDTLRNIWRG